MKLHEDRDFTKAERHARFTTGEALRMLRELKGWTQKELSKRSGIQVSNISLLENDKIEIGKKRVLGLANALGVHPAIIMFPEYEEEDIRIAS
ncbi:hypothetical protein MNBD_NITROSPIRAE01-555 [hydrothermal vent metagenome]|uniref:HTH cro/C1-type domain-containing protein n=1 Tax=hydrothermal vent metagenome TaxID=652676 RepID=A0A3B1DF84_9ZZZZ